MRRALGMVGTLIFAVAGILLAIEGLLLLGRRDDAVALTGAVVLLIGCVACLACAHRLLTDSKRPRFTPR